MIFKHKGYIGQAKYSRHDQCYSGVIVNIVDTVHFEGGTPEEAKKAFRESLEDYFALCREEEGVAPETPMPHRLSVRVEPGLRRQIALAANKNGESVSAFVTEALQKALHAR